jgi:hypothetical protein
MTIVILPSYYPHQGTFLLRGMRQSINLEMKLISFEKWCLLQYVLQNRYEWDFLSRNRFEKSNIDGLWVTALRCSKWMRCYRCSCYFLFWSLLFRSCFELKCKDSTEREIIFVEQINRLLNWLLIHQFITKSIRHLRAGITGVWEGMAMDSLKSW